VEKLISTDIASNFSIYWILGKGIEITWKIKATSEIYYRFCMLARILSDIFKIYTYVCKLLCFICRSMFILIIIFMNLSIHALLICLIFQRITDWSYCFLPHFNINEFVFELINIYRCFASLWINCFIF
jgi:hypothetical protein